jgi:hypothetical protein
MASLGHHRRPATRDLALDAIHARTKVGDAADLADLAIADDVDARCQLLLNDFVNAFFDGGDEVVTIGRRSSRRCDLPEVVRRQQSAGVCGQNSIVTPLHSSPPYPASPWPVQQT